MDEAKMTTEFTLQDDQYTVVRYGAPSTREAWVELLGVLLDCGPDDAAVAYGAMFPDGYDRNGTEDVVLNVGALDIGGQR